MEWGKLFSRHSRVFKFTMVKVSSIFEPLKFHWTCKENNTRRVPYYIPMDDTTFELSVFWPSDTESRINKLRFSDSVSLSFITRLTLVTCICDDVAWSKVNFKHGSRDGKHDDVISRNMTSLNTTANVPTIFFWIKDQNNLLNQNNVRKRVYNHYIHIIIIVTSSGVQYHFSWMRWYHWITLEASRLEQSDGMT